MNSLILIRRGFALFVEIAFAFAFGFVVDFAYGYFPLPFSSSLFQFARYTKSTREIAEHGSQSSLGLYPKFEIF